MKLQIKFILYTVLLHSVCLVLSYLVFEKNKLFFVLSEVLIIISVLISVSLYRQFIRPLTTLSNGVNAIRDKDFSVKLMLTGQVEMDGLITVYNQMMDELRGERTRQEEQHFFLEKLIHTSPTGIIILDFDHQVKVVNPKAASFLTANADFLIQDLHTLQPGHSKMIKTGGLNTYKVQKSQFIDKGFARYFLLIEEVTAEIFEAEKNVYGKVIRMMAHEVNNSVGPVNSIMNMALITDSLWEKESNVQLKEALQIAIQRNQNLNSFVRNFADLVKLPALNLQQSDLVKLINSVAGFMRIQAQEKMVEFDFQLPPTPVFILADVQQMEQALVNIIKNAIEAMDMDNGGKICFMLDETKRQLLISDNGKGISNELNEQLFSPFFSTKKDGQGIGLTMVREILLNHEFEFSLKTVKPSETNFEIRF